MSKYKKFHCFVKIQNTLNVDIKKIIFQTYVANMKMICLVLFLETSGIN